MRSQNLAHSVEPTPSMGELRPDTVIVPGPVADGGPPRGALGSKVPAFCGAPWAAAISGGVERCEIMRRISSSDAPAPSGIIGVAAAPGVHALGGAVGATGAGAGLGAAGEIGAVTG